MTSEAGSHSTQRDHPTSSGLLFRISLAVVFSFFAVMCVQGLAAQWQFGHNGYNGAAFANAARNTLRFGTVGQAPGYFGFEPPGPHALYTHHPPMIHLHLVASMGVLGAEPWAARIVPAGYSFGCLLMVFGLTRRFVGRREAWSAAVLFATTPLHLIFANMVNHEQGAIFWCLCALYGYLTWLEKGGWAPVVLALVAFTIAFQFDWPPYYIAFFVAVHLLVIRIRGRPDRSASREQPTELALLSLLSAVTIANLAGYFGWIAMARGGLGEMWRAFALRSLEPRDYLGTLIAREWDLHGVLPILLGTAWLVSWLVRLDSHRTRPGELVAVLFLFAQLLHSSLFRQAGAVHSYWVYWLGPTLAIGGGVFAIQMIDRCSAIIRRTTARRPGREWVRRLALVSGVTMCAASIAAQLWYAVSQWRWGLETGHASYIEAHADQFEQILVARFAGQRFPRPSSVFWIDPGLEPRIELLYYLDAPAIVREIPPVLPSRTAGNRRLVVLADLVETRDPERVEALAARHGATIVDGRFVIIDASDRGGSTREMRFVRHGRHWWWSVVDPLHGPTTIEDAGRKNTAASHRAATPCASGQDRG